MDPRQDYVKFLREKVGHSPILIAHSALVVLNENNEILIEIRGDDGKQDIPGGGLELTETFEEAAMRELHEETGLYADELELLHIYSGPMTYYRYVNGDEIYGVDAIYIVRKYHGELKPQPKEVKELRFMKLEDIVFASPRNKDILVRLKAYLSMK